MNTVTQNTKAAADVEQHRRAVRANPRNAQAHALLGLALQRQGQLQDAVASQRRALELDPKLGGLHAVMAPALHDLRRYDEALDSYRKALSLEPNDADLQRGFSEVLCQLGRREEALLAANQALQLRPDCVDTLFAIAAAQHALHDHAAAAETFQRALDLSPGDVHARLDLAQSLFRVQRFGAAEACYRQVIAQQPGHLAARVRLASTLREQKRFDEALACLDGVLDETPDNLEALLEKGIALQIQGRMAQAHEVLQRALALAPEHEIVLRTLTHNCFELGQFEDALRHARRGLEVAPSAAAHSALLFIMSHCCSDAAELTAEHMRFGERWEAPLAALRQPHANGRDPERQIRVGLVSADLYHHAVTRFLEPVLALLKDSEHLELHVYYTNTVDDEITAKLRGHVASWQVVGELSDDELEKRIREDGIDILLDLGSHSARNRLTLFARKPAPVQASWIGYAGTTGLQGMDYYPSDQFHLPEGRYDDQFSEKIVRLPLSAPFMPALDAPPVNPLPALANGYITFGSFHRASKVSREVVAQWARLLRAVPSAKMLLGGLQKGIDDNLLALFDAEGIDRARLILRERTTVFGFLQQHHEVDVCLSPFPYSGSTTICHALWMGVPTLATIGPTNPSHAAVCYMAHLGLSSFIADDDEAFIRLGQFLAENTATLAALRASMRERFTNSVVGYPGVAAAGLEHALRLMWQRWCDDLPAAPLRVRLSDLIPQEHAPE
jgi:predicted O-linked N-acetylglucosamine transferase (SPINDLY family)